MNNVLNQELRRFSKIFQSYTKWVVGAILLAVCYLSLEAAHNSNNSTAESLVLTYILAGIASVLAIRSFVLSWQEKREMRMRMLAETEKQQAEQARLGAINREKELLELRLKNLDAGELIIQEAKKMFTTILKDNPSFSLSAIKQMTIDFITNKYHLKPIDKEEKEQEDRRKVAG